jgi:hypothetical protein
MTEPSSKEFRLDPCRSKVFSWISWTESAPAVLDETTGRALRPAGPTLTVRYRYNGSEVEFWPVSESEARQVMNPGVVYDYSIGKAFADLIKSHKPSRQLKSGERQATKQQREEIETRAGRRWLA